MCASKASPSRTRPSGNSFPITRDDVLIRNVRILAPPHSPNTDAVDPFSSSNVRIDHLYADTGDDDIAIKSGAINSPGGDDPARDITITDCTFMHGHGLSIGSEIAGGAHNIVAERIHFEGTDNGIRVKANRDRGNDVSNLVFRDIDMIDVKNPIVISEYYPRILPPAGDVAPQPVTRLTPHFHNIVLENVTATGGEMAGAIVGLPEAPVDDVVLQKCHAERQNRTLHRLRERRPRKSEGHCRSRRRHPQNGRRQRHAEVDQSNTKGRVPLELGPANRCHSARRRSRGDLRSRRILGCLSQIRLSTKRSTPSPDFGTWDSANPNRTPLSSAAQDARPPAKPKAAYLRAFALTHSAKNSGSATTSTSTPAGNPTYRYVSA